MIVRNISMKIEENKKEEFLSRVDGLISEAKKILDPMSCSTLYGSVNDEKQKIVTATMVLAERIIKKRAPDYYKVTVKTLSSAKTADRALEIACGVLKYLQEEVVNGRLDCEFIEYSAEESQKLMMERF